MIKHQKSTPKLQTLSELKSLKAFGTDSIYLTNIYLYWEFALLSTTLLSILGILNDFNRTIFLVS